ncbi:MAG: hypothetical protein QG588_966 [Candidatus Poribacteria bacterium]|nr:hypothetical protein [Candidatus Poribacteria bacterium]
MIPLKEMKEKRFQFLYKLYEMTRGNLRVPISKYKIGKELSFDRGTTDLITQYLHAKSLIKNLELGGSDILITQLGIDEVDEVLSKPNEPTEHFPSNVINIGQMIDSNIQQASPDASQTVTFCDDDCNKLKEMMILLREFIDEDNELESDKKSELIAEIGTIEAQMSSPKPKHKIMIESLHSIRNVIEGATGSVLASKFLLMIQKFMASLS